MRRGVKAHRGGTYVCMEGPQFSTLAEAHVHRQLRFDVIGMTNVTEAKLAREAELCYATVAMITDYDCWHPEHSSVTARGNHRQSEPQRRKCAKRHSRKPCARCPSSAACHCGQSLEHAIITDRKMIPAAARRRLAAIVGKYLS